MSSTTDAVLSCRSFILSALVQSMEERSHSDSWIENERMAVAVAANQWAVAHGYERLVTVADVERIEVSAVGHVDYASKLALYVAEFVVVSGGQHSVAERWSEPSGLGAVPVVED